MTNYPATRLEIEDFHDLPGERESGITYDRGDEIHDNARRASGGMVALRAYGMESYHGAGFEDLQTILGDMLGDLQHACDALGLDFEEALRRAQGDYACELRGEPF